MVCNVPQWYAVQVSDTTMMTKEIQLVTKNQSTSYPSNLKTLLTLFLFHPATT
jgi:hypothetical protein